MFAALTLILAGLEATPQVVDAFNRVVEAFRRTGELNDAEADEMIETNKARRKEDHWQKRDGTPKLPV